jgi:hypothetical protein
VPAPNSWPNCGRERGAKVDNQVAAPTVSRKPTWQRAIIAQQRLRMEGWRQRRLGEKVRIPQEHKTILTPTGLLMEGIEGTVGYLTHASAYITVPAVEIENYARSDVESDLSNTGLDRVAAGSSRTGPL